MNSEQITAFLQEHWYIASVLIGAVILIGTIRNWNWLCDPTGTRDAHRHSKGYRRVVFFLLGGLLIVVSIWEFVLKLKYEEQSHDPRRTDPPISADGKTQLVFHQEMHYLNRDIAEKTARECYPEIRDFTYDILWSDLPKEVQGQLMDEEECL